MKKNLFQFLLLLTVTSLTLSSCKKDPDEVKNPVVVDQLYKKGVFILNEGDFMSSNASIDFYNRDSNTVISNVFEAVNGRPLGSLLQSMTIHDSLAYMVLNQSGKVEVMHVNTFVSKGVINGFSSPRYFIGIDANKGYVSDWLSDQVKIINLNTLTVVDSITVGAGPEQMIKVGNKVFVANSGSYGLDSTISVINTDNNQVIATIVVGHKPTALQLDANNKLWVLCAGNMDFFEPLNETTGSLVRVNSDNHNIELDLKTGGTPFEHPDRLIVNKEKNTLYYTGSYSFGYGVRKHSITDIALANTPFITGNYYGLGYDKVNDVIYCTDAKGFGQNGEVVRYNTTTGLELGRFNVGKNPNGIHFEF